MFLENKGVDIKNTFFYIKGMRKWHIQCSLTWQVICIPKEGNGDEEESDPSDEETHPPGAHPAGVACTDAKTEKGTDYNVYFTTPKIINLSCNCRGKRKVHCI